MEMGKYNKGKQRVQIGRTTYRIEQDRRFWQPHLEHNQEVFGSLIHLKSGDNVKQRNVLFRLSKRHLKYTTRH